MEKYKYTQSLKTADMTDMVYHDESDGYEVYVMDGGVQKYAGICTGYTCRINGEKYWMMWMDGAGKYLNINSEASFSDVRNPKLKVDAQKSLEKLVALQNQLAGDLLLASTMIGRLEAKGKNVDSYKKEVVALYSGYSDRQIDIKKFASIESRNPVTIDNNLEKIVKGEALGIAVWVIVVIVATILVGTWVAWYMLHKDTDDAASDCRKSSKLNKLLAGLDPDTKQQVFDWIDKNADDVYKKAVRRTRVNSAMGNWKTYAAVAAAVYLVSKFYKNK